MQTNSSIFTLPNHTGSLIRGIVDIKHPQLRLMILPDWQGGHTAYAQRMARLFATRLHAEVMIFHPYHADKTPKNYEEEGRQMVANLVSDRIRLRETIIEAIEYADTLWQQEKISPLVLIGFCFGGSLAFEAARAGATIATAISIHGAPVIYAPSSDFSSTSSVAIHYIGGGSDRLIPEYALSAFNEEQKATGLSSSLILLTGEGHSFTKEEVGQIGPYSRYSPKALERSLQLAASICSPQYLQSEFS